ncbi:PREDICTED: plectin-like [Priapulus caudatus]|uniref:Plectin-like n=1 Tax=Priapulus caudatus TaxID=37621 RepID=A0ABM1EAA8_PRICU|nr:PREDICTED: plectin-like [Priapulus caudatus]
MKVSRAMFLHDFIKRYSRAVLATIYAISNSTSADEIQKESAAVILDHEQLQAQNRDLEQTQLEGAKELASLRACERARECQHAELCSRHERQTEEVTRLRHKLSATIEGRCEEDRVWQEKLVQLKQCREKVGSLEADVKRLELDNSYFRHQVELMQEDDERRHLDCSATESANEADPPARYAEHDRQVKQLSEREVISLQEKMEELVVAGREKEASLQQKMEQLVVEGREKEACLQEKIEQLLVAGREKETSLQAKMEELVVEGREKETSLQVKMEELVVAGKEKEASLQEKIEELLVAGREKEASLQEKEAKVAESQAKVTEYEAKVAEHEAKVTEYKVKIAEYEVAVADYEVKVAECEAKVMESQAKVTEIEAKVTEYEAKVTEFQAKVDEYEVKVAECERRETELSCRLLQTDDDHRVTTQQLLDAAAEQCHEDARRQSKIKVLERNEFELTEQVTELELEIAQTKEAAGGATAVRRDDSSDADTDATVTAEETENGEAPIEHGDKEHNGKQSAMETDARLAEARVASLEAQLAGCSQQIAELQRKELRMLLRLRKFRQLKQDMVSYERLQKKLASVEQSEADTRVAMETMRVKMEETQQEEADAHVAMETMRVKMEEMQQEEADARVAMETMRAKMEEMQQERASMKEAARERVDDEGADSRSQASKRSLSLAPGVTAKLTYLERKICSLVDSETTLTDRVAELETTEACLRHELEKHQQSVEMKEHLRQELEKHQQSVEMKEHLRQELATLTEERQRLVAAAADRQGALDAAAERQCELETENASLKDAVKQVSIARDDAARQLRDELTTTQSHLAMLQHAERRAHDLEESVGALQSAALILERQENIYKSHIGDLEASVDALRAEMDAATAALQGATDARTARHPSSLYSDEQLHEKVAELVELETSLRQRIHELQQKEAAYRTTLAEADSLLRDAADGYRTQISELETSERALKERVAALERNEARLQGALRRDWGSDDKSRICELQQRNLQLEIGERRLRERVLELQRAETELKHQVALASERERRADADRSAAGELYERMHALELNEDELQKQVSVLEMQEAALRETLAQADRIVAERERALVARIGELEAVEAESERAMVVMTAATADARRSEEETREKLEEAEERERELRQREDAASAEKQEEATEKERAMRTLEEKLEKAEEKLSQQTAEFAGVEDQLREEVNELRNQVRGQKSEVARLESGRRGNAARTRKIADDKMALERQVAELENINRDMVRRYEAAAAEGATAAERQRELEARAFDLEKVNASLRQQVEYAAGQERLLTVKVADLEEKVAEAGEEREELERMRTNVIRSEANAASDAVKLNKLERLEGEQEHLRMSAQQLQRDRDCLEQQRQELEADLDRATWERDDASQRCETAETEARQFKKLAEILEAAREKVTREVKQLSADKQRAEELLKRATTDDAKLVKDQSESSSTLVQRLPQLPSAVAAANSSQLTQPIEAVSGDDTETAVDVALTPIRPTDDDASGCLSQAALAGPPSVDEQPSADFYEGVAGSGVQQLGGGCCRDDRDAKTTRVTPGRTDDTFAENVSESKVRMEPDTGDLSGGQIGAKSDATDGKDSPSCELAAAGGASATSSTASLASTPPLPPCSPPTNVSRSGSSSSADWVTVATDAAAPQQQASAGFTRGQHQQRPATRIPTMVRAGAKLPSPTATQQYKAALKRREEEAAELQQMIKKMKEVASQDRFELDVKKREVRDLQRDLKKLSKIMRQRNDEGAIVSALQSQVENTQLELESMRASASRGELLDCGATAQLDALKEEHENALQELQAEADRWRQGCDAAEAGRRKAEDTVTSLWSQLIELQTTATKYKQLQTQHDQLQEEMKELAARERHASDEIAQLEESCATLRGRLAREDEGRSEADALRKKFTTVEDELNKRKQKEEAYIEEINQLKQKVDSLNELSTKLEGMEKEHANLREKYEEVEKRKLSPTYLHHIHAWMNVNPFPLLLQYEEVRRESYNPHTCITYMHG